MSFPILLLASLLWAAPTVQDATTLEEARGLVESGDTGRAIELLNSALGHADHPAKYESGFSDR